MKEKKKLKEGIQHTPRRVEIMKNEGMQEDVGISFKRKQKKDNINPMINHTIMV